jgi:Tat protein translocase TatB subunit
MFGLGGGELFLVLLLAILLIGPRDLPRVATQIGRFYRKLRSAAEDLKDTVERETEWKDPPRNLEKK